MERSKARTRLVYVRKVVWHKVRPGKPIFLVISRDPEGREKDDFFFTTDLSMDPARLISLYADRWAIEDTFRNCKQYLGIQEPQSWKFFGPEQVAVFGYFIYGLVWLWFIKFGQHKIRLVSPWYREKTKPSFLDALASLRSLIWGQRFIETVPEGSHMRKFTRTIIQNLSKAA